MHRSTRLFVANKNDATVTSSSWKNELQNGVSDQEPVARRAVDLVESPCHLSILLEADPHEALACLLKCLPLDVLWLFAGQQ